MLQISQQFQSLVKASVDGTYNDPFFGSAESEPGYQKRIRAVMQNLNFNFAERLNRSGHHREIIDTPGKNRTPRGVILTTREAFMDHIQHLMQRSRGRELPGTFSPMIVADLFLEQSAPWEGIARSHIITIWKAVREFLGHVATYIADTATSKALFQKIFEPALNNLLEILKAKITELLIPHQKGHPITYNHYFTETLQKVRNKRNEDEYTDILRLRKFFAVSSLDAVDLENQCMDLKPLVAALVQRVEPDMNCFACSEALDCMEAYYKVGFILFSTRFTASTPL